MLARWFSSITLPLSWRQFHQLPQDPAYKYEYVDNSAWLSPRPKFYSARLELQPRAEVVPEELDAQESIRFRRFEDGDWHRLSRVFAGAFHRVQPFASLSDRRRLESARSCLKFTREGGDGPLIRPACHVAFSKEHGNCRGAILVTLIPMIDLNDFWTMRWKTEPPPDCIERRLGRPHVTWIFVGPWHAGHGIGTALLAHASRSLLDLGYTELVSSFILGNTSSMLWHWRNGFVLLPHVGSIRRMTERIKNRDSRTEGWN
jgi:GNAT superfamily N-acetyltransferase